MAAPRLSNADKALLEEAGFEFSEPPAKAGTRASKYDDTFDKARQLCMKFPGRTLFVMSRDKQSMPYTIAKAINNGEHRAFKGDDAANWTAVARKYEEDGAVKFGLWLTYTGEKPTDEE